MNAVSDAAGWPRTAVLLMDLQRDFLADSGARMPVAPADAERVIAVANAVLDGRLLDGALPMVVANAFPPDDRIGNLVRRGAALAGSPGAQLDERVHWRTGLRRFDKRQADAFSHPGLEAQLRQDGVRRLVIVGVFAEGCVLRTALGALKRGFEVWVPRDGVGSDHAWKQRIAAWVLRRAGADLSPIWPHLAPSRPAPAAAGARSGRS